MTPEQLINQAFAEFTDPVVEHFDSVRSGCRSGSCVELLTARVGADVEF